MKTIVATSRRTILKAGLGMGAATSLALFRGGASKQHASDATHEDVGTPKASPEASPGATPQSGEVVTVAMTKDSQFDPAELVVAVGTTVEWANESELEHTATGDPEQNPFKKTRPELIALPDSAEPWGSELLKPGETYRHTFTVAGDYLYICYPHVLSGMQGKIRVDE